MTRAETLALYRPMRAAMQRALSRIGAACPRADIERAIKQICPFADDEFLAKPGVGDMVIDVALFEPNQRGARAFDKVLASPRLKLDPEDRALATRMAGAFFSLFGVAGKNRAGGAWLEDLLAGNRRIWLMDEEAAKQLRPGMVFGARLFDAGPFHCAFGLLVRPTEDTVEVCAHAAAAGWRLPVRYSLAARVYSDAQMPEMPEPSNDDLLRATAELLRMLAEAEQARKRRR